MGSASITLAELCEIPHLGLTPLAGSSELHRRVVWTHVSEMEDPTPFLEGGELLMSVGLRFPGSAKAQVGYIERLAQGEIAGFALTEEECPQLTDAALSFADELPFPILSVAPEVSFIEVVRTVANANNQASQRRLMTHIRIFDSLQSRIAAGWTTAELLSRIGKLTGYDLYAEAVEGGELLDGVPVAPARIARHLTVPVERPVSIADAHVLPIVLREANRGHLVAVERSGEHAAGLVSVQHAATIVTLELEREDSAARLVDGYRASTLTELLSGELSPATARRRLAHEGFDSLDDLVLIALDTVDGSPVDAPAVERFSELLRRRAIPNLLAITDHAYGLLPTTALSEPLIDSAGQLRAGASRPLRAQDGLELARREALAALHAAAGSGKRLVVAGDDAGRTPVLPVDRPSLERLVETVLGPLLRYDAEHQTALVESLRCYLESDRGLRDAAGRLFVHSNTLAYRLRRIEQICDVRLASVETQTDFWLALKAQRMLSL